MKYKCLATCLYSLFLSNFSYADQVDALIYDDSISYYRYFVTKKVLGRYPNKICQVFTFLPFSPPSVLILIQEKSTKKSYIVRREFNNKKLHEELSKKLISDKKDYFNDASVSAILGELDTDVEENRIEISKSSSDTISAQCDDMISQIQASARQEKKFDEVKIYLTTYSDNSIKAKEYRGSNLTLVSQLVGKMQKELDARDRNKVTK